MEKQKYSTGKSLVAGSLLHFTLLILFSIFEIPLAFSQQNKGKVSGKVISSDGQPLPFASIALLDQEGKTLKGTLSDTVGMFHFVTIIEGNYKVKITTMGFNTHHSKPFDISSRNNNNIHLGVFTLFEDAKVLNSVTINAKKKLIEQTIDRTVINVENSILSEGNTALELLEKTLGVKVDEDGKISLKGRSGVNVMINGKPTYLSPKELSTILKGTNSSSISKIEILNNPSAKYDAAGNAGIINIIMKKNTATGFNGAIALNSGYSRNAHYGSGLNLNYRNDKVNLYGGYNYAYRGETEYLDFVRRFYDTGIANGQPQRTSFQHTNTNEPLNTHNFRIGFDYELDKANSFGILINGNLGKYTHDSKTDNNLISNNNSTISKTITSNYDQQHWENLTYNANYLHQFKKEGRELSADVDFASNSFTSNLNLNTITLLSPDAPSGTIASRKGYVPAVTDVYIGKVDYTDQFGKTVKFESGLKSSFIQSDNNLKYHILDNGNWVYDVNGSNHFKYKEQIHAGYININKEFKGFSLQVGLRGEYTQTQGHQITSDSLLNRNYFQLFPSVFLNKPIGENHQFQAAYSRRIERPDYGDLNPFRVFRDPLLYYQGNPFLKPQLTNTFQLSHTFKGKYTTAINYNQTNDAITWITGQIDALNTTFETPKNLSKAINYGISFTASTELLNWWTGTYFANAFRNEYRGSQENEDFKNANTSFSFNTQNSFKAGKGYSMELSAFWYSGSVYGISTYKASYAVSTGIQKQIFNDKGSIKLMVNDVFQTNRYQEQTFFQNIDMNTDKRLDSRRAMLSFSYRFGNQNLSKKERKSASEDIQSRVKGGG
ncbi:outer membrane beta-barrel family protein [Pedobacter hiemivivus]|uniref:TonB-dependent receptor n=1 Tax=Pedobacter hiemivivus TaxID=2530454 RepID=A0A4R0MV75_9SPHI|nr:outer membrane beta-barrel family protein [Pedobacter hiemivivus]TCC91045.1 TonB-dependent receptor [Pedobacter hiemivivus]